MSDSSVPSLSRIESFESFNSEESAATTNSSVSFEDYSDPIYPQDRSQYLLDNNVTFAELDALFGHLFSLVGHTSAQLDATFHFPRTESADRNITPNFPRIKSADRNIAPKNESVIEQTVDILGLLD